MQCTATVRTVVCEVEYATQVGVHRLHRNCRNLCHIGSGHRVGGYQCGQTSRMGYLLAVECRPSFNFCSACQKSWFLAEYRFNGLSMRSSFGRGLPECVFNFQFFQILSLMEPFDRILPTYLPIMDVVQLPHLLVGVRRSYSVLHWCESAHLISGPKCPSC